MTIPRIFRNQLLLARTETVFGTDSLPAAPADFMLSYEIDVAIDATVVDYPIVRRSISDPQTRMGLQMANLTFSVPLRGSGTTADAPPQCAPLLRACRLSETIVGATPGPASVTYAPAPPGVAPQSCTIYRFIDGLCYRVVGCRGNVRLVANAGELPVLEFTMSGRLTFVGDAAMPAATGLVVTPDPVVVGSAGVSFGTFHDAVVMNMSLSTMNEVAPERNVNAPSGATGTTMGSRNPQWTATVRTTLEATRPWQANRIGRVMEEIDLNLGAVAGNTVRVLIPRASISPDGITERNEGGQLYYDLSGQASENVENDNFSIRFT